MARGKTAAKSPSRRPGRRAWANSGRCGACSSRASGSPSLLSSATGLSTGTTLTGFSVTTAFRGLGWEQICFAFTTFQGGVYQPLGWLLQSLTYELFGLDPRGYHLVSLVLHVLNVILLHLLCLRLVATSLPEAAKRLGGALGWLCGVPVALYAVHPLRVEPVAWASCQAYLPGVACSLLATLAYLRAHSANGVDRRRWMIGSSVLIVLAVLAKGSAVVLPFVFLILDAYPLARLGPGFPSWSSARKILLEKGAILVFCLAFTVVAFAAKRTGEDPEVTAQPVPVARVAQASFGAWFYLAKTLWPFGITAFYPRPEGGDFQTPLFAACVAGAILAVVLAIWQRRKRPWLLTAMAAYLVIASPYLGLARVGITLAADRYSYAPTMVWVVLGCAGLCGFVQRSWSRPVGLGAGAGTLLIACGLMALCSAQCRVWGESEHLWGQALEHAEWSADVHHFMGTALADEGKLDRGIAEFREAHRIRPHDVEIICDLGAALDQRGETDAAIACLREAARLGPRDARVLLNLGGPWCTAENSTRRSGFIAKHCRFSRTFPASTSIWVWRSIIKGRSTRQSGFIARRCRFSRTLPTSTSISAWLSLIKGRSTRRSSR